MLVMFKKVLKLLIIVFLISFVSTAKAQNERSQLPSFLQKSYFEVNVGIINYPFTQAHLEDGFTFHSLQVPPMAVRLVLFGYQFNKSFSVRISYMRPVAWLKYNYTVDELTFDHLLDLQVWMNYASLNLKYEHALNKKLSLFAEGGYSIVTRNGYTGWYGTVVKSTKFNTVQLGVGISYQLNKKWKLQLSGVFTPENKNEKQPYTSFVSAGFTYRLAAYTKKQLEKTKDTNRIHPKQMIQFGFSSNTFGYGANNFLEKAYLFWGGDAEVNHGLTFMYQRNIFYSTRFFSMDWGTSLSFWQSDLKKESFFTFSVFPVLRFTFLRTKKTDAYLFYAVAGPTYISRVIIDEIDTGGHFTFQDNMGLGLFFGDQRKYNAEIRIGHYSNGNILPKNPGIKVPLTFSLGFTF